MRETSEQEAEGADRRRHKRAHVLLSGQLITGIRSAPAVVLDMSAGGARLRLSKPIAFGTASTLRLAGGLDFHVDVVWREGLAVGLKFREDPARIAATLAGLLPADCLAA